MNKKILLLLVLTIFACSSKPEIQSIEKFNGGWAGNPDNPSKQPFDYYYIKSKGRADQKSINEKDTKNRQLSCINASKSQVKERILNKAIHDSFHGVSGNTDRTEAILVKEYQRKK